MKTSEKYYGAAIGIVLLIASLGDSGNFTLWTVIAVIGILAATGLVYAGRVSENREKGTVSRVFYRKWQEEGEKQADGGKDDNITQDRKKRDEIQSRIQTGAREQATVCAAQGRRGKRKVV